MNHNAAQNAGGREPESATVVDLVFDGQCGFCTRSANWIRRLDRSGSIQIHPAQKLGIHERFQLTAADTQRAAWAISGTHRLSGAAAVNLSLDVALGLRVFSMLYRFPPVRWIQDRIYAWVASHRYLLRGTTPWCVTHPEDCELAVNGATCTPPPGAGPTS